MTETVYNSGTRRSSGDQHVEASMLASGPGYITQSGLPTDEQFEFIRSNFGDPRANVEPSDYYVFRMIASGDGLDSYFTRQDVATSFPNFVRDLRKGQSLLGHHIAESFSYGSSFAGEVIPADETKAEYEGTFYPQWDTPELRTKNWLVGDYYITRGVTLNNQSADSLVRSIELGGARKASISFMVGQYLCGIDGHDLMSTMFGPMPDETCNHFPGVAYEGQIAWALMKNNTMVETSLVYKNASPSSMLLRKAETLAARGVLSAPDIQTLEGRFEVRLPRYEQRLWRVLDNGTATTGTETVQFTYTGIEEGNNMGTARSSGDPTVRELAREALIAEPVADEAEQAAEATTEVAVADVAETAAVDTEAAVTEGVATAETEEAEPETVTEEVAADEAVAEAETATEEVSVPPTGAADTAPVEASAAEEVTDNESSIVGTAQEVAVAAFIAAADRLASELTRNASAFDTGQLAVAARSERALDLALVDAGCDTTVGGHVARTFEVRSKALREALGEPLTVEAIRNLQSKATLGDSLYEELVKDAVAARTGAQGEEFNADKYGDLLMAARDVAYVKEEIASWKGAKSGRFTPGRSVVPRQVADVNPSKEARKSLPEVPTGLATAKSSSSGPSSNIFDRK